jgi:UDP-glucose 4-epimerase
VKPPERYCIVGGAGFIGSHFVDALLAGPDAGSVTIFDNFSSGREWHFAHHAGDTRLRVARGDVADLATLCDAVAGHDVVIHLASNPDIARAATDPQIDFSAGTRLTQNVIEAMRRTGCNRILYASGSGVYGDLGTTEAHEDFGPLIPISTYGASKLAGEAMIAAYCHMFGLTGCAFRFGNVVGARQTHGVCFDFLHRLLADGTRLRILGDGYQSKSYVHVSDVVTAVLHAHRVTTQPYRCFNVATPDSVTVREIAAMAIRTVGLKQGHVELLFTGGDRGWKGDVPVIRLNCDRLRDIGWECQYTAQSAVRRSLIELLPDVHARRL